jgi:hypothetical protein
VESQSVDFQNRQIGTLVKNDDFNETIIDALQFPELHRLVPKHTLCRKREAVRVIEPIQDLDGNNVIQMDGFMWID